MNGYSDHKKAINVNYEPSDRILSTGRWILFGWLGRLNVIGGSVATVGLWSRDGGYFTVQIASDLLSVIDAACGLRLGCYVAKCCMFSPVDILLENPNCTRCSHWCRNSHFLRSSGVNDCTETALSAAHPAEIKNWARCSRWCRYSAAKFSFFLLLLGAVQWKLIELECTES